MKKILLIIPLFFFLTFADGVSVESFKVENEKITYVAKLLAKLTKRGLVINPSVRGRITIDLKGHFTGEELWNIFSKAIAQLGYTLRYNPNRNIVFIEPTNIAKRFVKKGVSYGGEYSLLIVKLKYLEPSNVYESIRSFLSPYGRIISINRFNVLVISDYGTNLNFVKSFLKEVDKPKYAQTLKVYRFKNITAREFEKIIQPLINWYRSHRRFPIYMTVLENKNLLVLSAPEELQKKVELLKEKVDKPSSKKGEDFGFYILKLKYTSVDEVKNSITRLFRQIRRDEKNIVFPSGIKISFDKTNNAILVFGTKKAFENFKKFVSLVDRRKKQVLITALIVEASAKDIIDKGIKWQILGDNGGAAFGATSQQGLYEAMAQGSFVLGALSNSGTKVSIGGSTLFFPDLVFLYSLLKQGTGFNIISNPKVLTLDNQPASIKVGQNVPFPTGIKYDVNGNPIITYDYKYVGLDLDVVPHITGKNIRLVLKLKVQEVTGYLNNNVGGINYSVPITSTRELNSDVIVENGQTVIIGGLISRKSLLSSSKVPGLGDIPVIGQLFSSTHKESDKTNLFIFVTPFVISSPKELEKIMEFNKKLAQELMTHKKKKEVKVEPQEDNEVVLPYN